MSFAKNYSFLTYILYLLTIISNIHCVPVITTRGETNSLRIVTSASVTLSRTATTATTTTATTATIIQQTARSARDVATTEKSKTGGLVHGVKSKLSGWLEDLAETQQKVKEDTNQTTDKAKAKLERRGAAVQNYENILLQKIPYQRYDKDDHKKLKQEHTGKKGHKKACHMPLIRGWFSILNLLRHFPRGVPDNKSVQYSNGTTPEGTGTVLIIRDQMFNKRKPGHHKREHSEEGLTQKNTTGDSDPYYDHRLNGTSTQSQSKFKKEHKGGHHNKRPHPTEPRQRLDPHIGSDWDKPLNISNNSNLPASYNQSSTTTITNNTHRDIQFPPRPLMQDFNVTEPYNETEFYRMIANKTGGSPLTLADQGGAIEDGVRILDISINGSKSNMTRLKEYILDHEQPALHWPFLGQPGPVMPSIKKTSTNESVTVTQIRRILQLA